MSIEIEAVYENGLLRPCRQLHLEEGQKVNVIIDPGVSAAKRFCGSLRWTGRAEELHAFLEDVEQSQWS